MRKISKKFLQDLQSGFLRRVAQLASEDHDLDLEIRENEINLYFKGHALLRLHEKNGHGYTVNMHPKFKAGLDIPDALVNKESVTQFLDQVPYIKMNVQKVSGHSIEAEYEQLIIRANNLERRSNTEYFILDRQYVVNEGRFDLTGFYWPNPGRHRGQEVAMCLMEVKFSLNSDIANLDEQVSRYYHAIEPRAAYMAEEGESILNQKLELGLFDQSPDRLAAMKTLHISRDISSFQFIIFLVDFNPYSSLFDLAKVKALPFAKQIKIFIGGLGLWDKNIKSVLDMKGETIDY